MKFIEELKRRHVIRVGITYAITGWVMLQVADLAVDSFGAPGWVMKMLFTLITLGFFVALGLAWAFQWTNKGVQRDVGDKTASPAGRKTHYLGYGVLLLAVAFLLFERFSGPPADIPFSNEVAASSASVAVLPFANMSSNAENEYFSDGLTDTLLHQLAQVPSLQVAARTSSFAFKNTNQDIRDIAKALSVDHVLEGSVQRAGNTVRITAQLIQASDGYHLWSGTFDRSLDDIFAVQDEIASQVALALRGSLLDEVEVAATRGGGTDNTEAYDLYLRALEGFRTETERATRDAERQLRRATEKDPNFALAWSLLARTIMQRGYLEGMRREDWSDEALSTANMAVELAPKTTMTLATLGFIHLNRQEFSLGIDRLEQALALEPNHAQALSWLSAAQFGSMKYEDALRTAQRAMSIDPLDYKLKGDSVFLFTQVGQLQEAELLAKSVLANDPNPVNGLGALGNLYWRTGRLADAIEVYQKLLAINPNFVSAMDRITQSYYWVGDFESAERWLQRVEAVNPRRGRYTGARTCFYQGDLDCALAYMDMALKYAANDRQRNDALGEIAWMTRDWPVMLEMKQYDINSFKARGVPGNLAFELSWGALAADRMDDIKLRDAYISDMMTSMENWAANGGDSQYHYWLVAEAQALAGNAEKTAELLNKGIDRGYRDLQRLLMGGHYEKILDHPAIKAAVARLTEINRRELEAMRLVDPVE